MVEIHEGNELPLDAVESIILAPGEEIQNAWRAWYKYPPPPNTVSTIAIGDMSGFLLLSNRRLAFIASKGLLTTSYSVALAICYEDVLGVESGSSSHGIRVSYKGSLAPAVLSNFMELSTPTSNILMDKGALVPSTEIKKIMSQRIKTRLGEIEEEHKIASTQLVLDFSFLKSTLEKGGVIVQSMKCPNCGAGIKIPDSGSTIRCEYCGSYVKATDLLERIKELITAVKSSGTN